MGTPNEPNGRLAAFGNQLVQVHLWLRDELDELRENVDAYLEGRGGLPQELRAHCLTFCTAIGRHHTGEDAGAFPALAAQFPELRPVLEKLEHDHEMVADIMRRLQELLDGLDAGAGPDRVEAQRVRGELDGLSSLLESHFVYEEKQLVAALNALDMPDWDAAEPSFLST